MGRYPDVLVEKFPQIRILHVNHNLDAVEFSVWINYVDC